MKCPTCGKQMVYIGVDNENGKSVYKCNACNKHYAVNGKKIKMDPEAKKLYREFTSHMADKAVPVKLSMPSDKNPLVWLGKVSGIIYVSDKEGIKGQKYIHNTDQPYPDLFVTKDKKTFIIAGGRMTVQRGWLYY